MRRLGRGIFDRADIRLRCMVFVYVMIFEG